MNFFDMVAIPLIARVCLVVMFPFSALDKIVHWKEAMQQATSSFLPGGAVLLVIAIIVEFVTPVCVVIGWHDRLAAFVLAGFCAVTALLYHPFWKYPHFWSKAGDGHSHFWDFLKNFGLVGGLLLVVIGGMPMSASAVLEHPLSSAPYGSVSPMGSPASSSNQ
ncbi:DoxX (plasmid) [Caballeronia sp. SBC1]|uniref:DoxX family protein n=1 Tax=unclassified Caballeronia TaxID=2646786 RepID=UPI0013E15348|nr:MULTISPECIES: DoxX family protein [unclassified Caballeronia]QIE29975.1 DoxX [Caballeronia sp. SBC2]QIN67686.1 DoxX [Caballeronia sp. SBC1]